MKCNHKKTIAILLCVISLLAIGVWIILDKYNKPNIEVSFCKSVGKELTKENLEFYRLSYIKETEQGICFCFSVKEYENFEYSKCLPDMINVKKGIENYCKNNPDNELNYKLINVRFDTFPGDIILGMSNNRGNEVFTQPVVLSFFSNVETSIVDAEGIKDARTIGFVIKSFEELKHLEQWNNLEFTEIIGPELTEEQMNYVISILPNCEIIYNGKNITPNLK